MTNTKSTSVVRSRNRFDPTDLIELEQMARRLSESDLVRKDLRGKPEDTFLVLLQGAELGLSTMQSLQGIYIIHGRTGMMADTMAALCLSSPVCDYIRPIEQTDDMSTWEVKRVGMEPHQGTYTVGHAKVAGLIKEGSGWAKHPGRMCSARAKSYAMRDIFPDILAGLLTPDELDEISAREMGLPVTEVPKDGPIVDIQGEESNPVGHDPEDNGATQAVESLQVALAKSGNHSDSGAAFSLLRESIEATGGPTDVRKWTSKDVTAGKSEALARISPESSTRNGQQNSELLNIANLTDQMVESLTDSGVSCVLDLWRWLSEGRKIPRMTNQRRESLVREVDNLLLASGPFDPVVFLESVADMSDVDDSGMFLDGALQDRFGDNWQAVPPSAVLGTIRMVVAKQHGAQ